MPFTRSSRPAKHLLHLFGFALLFIAAPVAAKPVPRLAVVIVVDQMRADYLRRLASEYRGGFARLQKEGTGYLEAHHDHAVTVTAVGHATISTGCFPSHHGIVGNSWWDRSRMRTVQACDDSTVHLAGGTNGQNLSPRALRHTALGDWLKKQSPQSHVFSVSGKDRAAILMGGEHPDGAWWYDEETGDFVTSTYYLTKVPDWVDSFNRSGAKDQYYRQGWTKGFLQPAYASAHADSFPAENDGIHITFPHLFDTTKARPDSVYYEAMEETPYGDELLLNFARALIQREHLGADSIPDLLWIGCSSTDLIGHSYGPDSQEMIDNLLRLDRNLGDFFRFLDETVGAGQYATVLTADHGVMQFPEDLAQDGIMAERVHRKEYDRLVDSVVAVVADSLGITTRLIVARTGGIVLDTSAAVAHGITPENLRQAITGHLRHLKFVDDVMTYGDLFLPGAVVRGYRDMYRRSFCPDRAPDLVLQLSEYTLIDSDGHGTTHGSPYLYDTHVPLIFAGPGIRAGQLIAYPTRTVNIAPTLAIILGVIPPADVDGTILNDVVGK